MNIKRQKMLRLSLSYLVIFVMCAIIFYPLLWIIGSSFNPGDSLSGSSIIPQNATLDHYRKLLEHIKSKCFNDDFLSVSN